MIIEDRNREMFEKRMATLQEGYSRQELTPYECTFFENLRDGYKLAQQFDNIFHITVKQYNFLNQTAYELETGRRG